MIDPIVKNLGKDADTLLNHSCKTISKDMLHLPGPDFVDRVVRAAGRNGIFIHIAGRPGH
jgi:class I fructose-bisphosphate aldolase